MELIIDTREELINALTEAAELEHGLLVQYLFAAYSMKTDVSEGLTVAEAERNRGWERKLLEVAREEMAHLGTVCNLLQAIGGAPHFSRPNFPQPKHRYYPFAVKLARFSQETLERFIAFEQPTELSPSTSPPPVTLSAAPEPIAYTQVGELYRKIADGFRRLDAVYRERGTTLFIGPPDAQDKTDWTENLNINPVKDLDTALVAIDSIILEGEGAPAGRVDSLSHYATFRSLLAELRRAQEQNKSFDPARPVLETPLTRVHPESGKGYHLLEPGTAAFQVAELFNACYSTVLLLLLQFYDYGGESKSQREGVQANIRRTMSAILRPLSEVLTTLPVHGKAKSGATAGPGFEIYGELRLPGHLPSRWTVLLERVDAATRVCRELAVAHAPQLPRLEFIAANLELLHGSLQQLSMEGQ